MNKMKRLTGKKILLMAVVFCAFGFAKAQETQTAGNTLTLTLEKALEIALDENPTMKVAAEEIALKKVAGKKRGKVCCRKPVSQGLWIIRSRQPK